MRAVYRAVLHGNRLEWRDEVPAELPADRGVEVSVEILDNEDSPAAIRTRGADMAAPLEQLAAAGGPKSFGRRRPVGAGYPAGKVSSQS